MKTKIFSILIVLLTLMGSTIEAKNKKDKIKTNEFEVQGVCNDCKARIENAALIKGVKKVDWEKETGKLTVIYDSTKTNVLLVHKSVAKAGHATSKIKADQEAYNKLPACCKYNDGVSKH